MKKKEALFRAIGGVGDDLIARAEQPVSKKNTVWLLWTALAACCALVACIAAYAAVYCASMWLIGMNSYEKSLISRPAAKLFRRLTGRKAERKG